jgi:hypothetical protein
MKVVARSTVASRSAFAGARIATRSAPKATTSRSAVRTMALFGGGSKTAADSIYDIKVTNIDGKEIKMSQYKGKALLIVNVASGKNRKPIIIFIFFLDNCATTAVFSLCLSLLYLFFILQLAE